MRWKDDPIRAELLSLYARTDALVADATCACSMPSVADVPPDAVPQPSSSPSGHDREDRTEPFHERVPCCHFEVTGREPYPTAVELAEVFDAVRGRGARARPTGRRLRVVPEHRRCPLLGDDARCMIYASRPFGCRTFFCDRGDGLPKNARGGLREVARRIADLSARAFPRDPLPRPLVAALNGARHLRP
jgi:hypothetical protein